MDDEAGLSGEGSSDEASDESGDDFERDFIDIASQPVGSIAMGCALPGQDGWLSCLGGAGLLSVSYVNSMQVAKLAGACFAGTAGLLCSSFCHACTLESRPYRATLRESLSESCPTERRLCVGYYPPYWHVQAG